MKPFHILFFLLIIIAGLAGISAIFPEEGIQILSQKITFPPLSSYFNAEPVAKTDISKIVALANAEDSISEADTPKSDTTILKKEPSYAEVKDEAIKLITVLQYKDSVSTALDDFFRSLAELTVDGSETVRVLHYGDSQIEGDRITDYLRQKLQKHFGGSGPGIIAAIPVAQSVGIRQSWSDNWDRYTIFAGKDKRVSHNNFGIAGGFCRFNPYDGDTVNPKKAWLKIRTNDKAGSSVANYHTVKLFYGGGRKKSVLSFFENGELRKTDTLKPNNPFQIKSYALQATPREFEMKFSGKDSPDIYGLSLESPGGIMVDNFGLRGSSGTFFNQMNLQHLKLFYDYLNVKLIILQFGGNALPVITDEKMAENFGIYLRSQINGLRKILPGINVLVIGPADMSIKDGDTYVTHPQLENVRNAIRQAAFQTNSAFFDMYDCMGGKNSMVSWVEQGIAATDYIHFSPAGARKIAVLLYSAMMSDYNRFVQRKKNL